MIRQKEPQPHAASPLPVIGLLRGQMMPTLLVAVIGLASRKLAGNRAAGDRGIGTSKAGLQNATVRRGKAVGRASQEVSMDLYIGLDVSMDETSICVVDSDGTIIKESKAATDPTAIHSALKAYTDRRLQRVGLEAQAFSPWLSKELSAMGLPVIVVEAVHMQKALSVQRNQTP
jgi:hypothetical protein